MTIIGTIKRMFGGGPAEPVFVVDSNGDIVSSFGGGGPSSITAPLGRQADAASVSTALSTEDVALLSTLLTTTAFQARLPSALVSGRLDVNVGAALPAGTNLIGNVGGAAASGSTVAGNPVLIGGSDGTNVRTLTMSAIGVPKVALVRSSDAIEGAYAITQGTFGSSNAPVNASAHFLLQTGNHVPQRGVDTFKTAAATASGNTAVWTPAAGKKFRLMRFRMSVTANAAQASPGVITLELRDGISTAIGVTASVFVPGSAGATLTDAWATGWIDLGNGYLSTTNNNVLNINLSSALTDGTVRINVCGTEE